MEHLPNHHQEERPWGNFEQFTLNEPSTVKIIFVASGKRFSLQRHAHRNEFWKIIDGDGLAVIGEESREVRAGDLLSVPQGTIHRLTGGATGLRLLEVAFGTFDENDIERLEDDFDRGSP